METPMNKHWGRGGKKKFFLIPIFILAFIAIKSAVVMALWNYLVPDLFHGPEIDYLHALALTILVKVLVGFKGGPRGGFGRKFGKGGPPWMTLSPEDREKLRNEIRNRMGEQA